MAEQQYALVYDATLMLDNDGNPVTTGFLSEPPEGYSERYPSGCRWVPIENVDKGVYDPMRTRRGPPYYEFSYGRVARIYPIIFFGPR
jgi:hypothetical protein